VSDDLGERLAGVGEGVAESVSDDYVAVANPETTVSFAGDRTGPQPAAVGPWDVNLGVVALDDTVVGERLVEPLGQWSGAG